MFKRGLFYYHIVLHTISCRVYTLNVRNVLRSKSCVSAYIVLLDIYQIQRLSVYQLLYLENNFVFVKVSCQTIGVYCVLKHSTSLLKYLNTILYNLLFSPFLLMVSK
jgi:hypothetical protein